MQFSDNLKVYVRANDPKPRTLQIQSSCSHLSFMATISADCAQKFPFFFIAAGAVFTSAWWASAPEGSLAVCSKKGSIDKPIFRQYISSLIAWIKGKKHPASTEFILFLDGPEVHIDLQALEMARNNHLHLITYPPHTTNHLQPLDVGVFGPFKKEFNRQLHKMVLSPKGKEKPKNWKLKKENLVMACTQAFQKAANPATIVRTVSIFLPFSVCIEYVFSLVLREFLLLGWCILKHRFVAARSTQARQQITATYNLSLQQHHRIFICRA